LPSVAAALSQPLPVWPWLEFWLGPDAQHVQSLRQQKHHRNCGKAGLENVKAQFLFDHIQMEMVRKRVEFRPENSRAMRI